MDLADQLELAEAKDIIELAEKRLRYLRGDRSGFGVCMVVPRPVTSDAVREAQKIIDRLCGGDEVA